MENTQQAPVVKWKTRIAPTPSGYLHLGNIYSFSVTAAFAEVTGACTLLRIDDLDSERTRDEYIDDIFETLNYLDLPWDAGPRNRVDFKDTYSQTNRKQLYVEALEKLEGSGVVYACTCSRSELAWHSGKGYPGTCRHKMIPLSTEGACWRLVTGLDLELSLRTPHGHKQMFLPPEMRDFVIRKKDGSASYQLSSIVDDLFFGINLVIRGNDLMPSTLAQLYLAKVLGMKQFSETLFYHHRLFCSSSGEKLSKSAGDTSVHFLKANGVSAHQVYEMVGKLSVQHPLRHWRDLCDDVSQLFKKNNDAGKTRL